MYEKERLSLVNTPTERELKMEDNHGLVSGNYAREVGVKLEGESNWKEVQWMIEQQQESLQPNLL